VLCMGVACRYCRFYESRTNQVAAAEDGPDLDSLPVRADEFSCEEGNFSRPRQSDLWLQPPEEMRLETLLEQMPYELSTLIEVEELELEELSGPPPKACGIVEELEEIDPLATASNSVSSSDAGVISEGGEAEDWICELRKLSGEFDEEAPGTSIDVVLDCVHTAFADLASMPAWQRSIAKSVKLGKPWRIGPRHQPQFWSRLVPDIADLPQPDLFELSVDAPCMYLRRLALDMPLMANGVVLRQPAFVLWHGVEIGLCNAEGTEPQFIFRALLDRGAIRSLQASLLESISPGMSCSPSMCVMRTQRLSCHPSDNNPVTCYGCAPPRQDHAVMRRAGVAGDVAFRPGLRNQHHEEEDDDEEETEGSPLDCRNVLPLSRRRQFEVVF